MRTPISPRLWENCGDLISRTLWKSLCSSVFQRLKPQNFPPAAGQSFKTLLFSDLDDPKIGPNFALKKAPLVCPRSVTRGAFLSGIALILNQEYLSLQTFFRGFWIRHFFCRFQFWIRHFFPTKKVSEKKTRILSWIFDRKVMIVFGYHIGCSPRNGNLANMKKSSRTFTAYLLPNTSFLEEMFPNFLVSEFTSTILLQSVQVTLLQKWIIRCSIITNNIVAFLEAIKIDTDKVRPVLETLGSSPWTYEPDFW